MEQASHVERVLVSATFSCLAVFGVVGNVLVIFVILRSNRLRTRLNLFIVNIAVSDLIFALLYGPVSAVSVARPGVLRDYTICPTVGIIGFVSAFESVFSAVLIAVSRCVRVTRSHRYEELFSRGRCGVLVIASWVLALLFTSPVIAGFGKAGFNPILLTCDYDSAASFGYFLSIVLPAVTICNVIIIVSYVLIYRKVRASALRVREYRSGEKISPMLLSQIKNMVAIYVAYNVCVSPDVLVNMLTYKIGDSARFLNVATRILYTCNTCVNPIIYTAGNKDFRDQLRALWQSLYGIQRVKPHSTEAVEIISMKTLSNADQTIVHSQRTVSTPNMEETRL